MCPRLIHLYGPVWIASYGVMIALSFLVFLLCTLYHPIRKKFISEEMYQNALFIGLFSGIMGGRILGVITEWESFSNNWIEIFYPWVGGFMVLGSIIGVLSIAPLYLYYNRIQILPLLDLAALYGPLMQAIARFGCLFSGCCYGIPATTDAWYAVQFSDPVGAAPLGIWLHPTQLYASLASFVIFLLMQIMYRNTQIKRGQLIFSYLTLESLARLAVDFWRDDRGNLTVFTFVNDYTVSLSQAQILSGLFLLLSLIGLLIVTVQQPLASYRTSSE